MMDLNDKVKIISFNNSFGDNKTRVNEVNTSNTYIIEEVINFNNESWIDGGTIGIKLQNSIYIWNPLDLKII